MRRAFAAAFLTLAGCSLFRPATSSSPPSQAPGDVRPTPSPLGPGEAAHRELQALREQVRALLRAQAELAWRSWALGEAIDLASLDAKVAALVTADSIEIVDRRLAELSAGKNPEVAEEARALRALRLYLAGERLAQATIAPSEALARIASQATLSVDGQELPFRDLEALLAGEAHAGRRRKIAQAALPVLRRLSGPLAERERALGEALQALGYPSPLAFSAELRQVDPDAVAALADAVLEKTEAPYRAAMEELARRELNLSGLSQVRRADVPRLLRTGEVDTYFPKEKLGPALAAALERMGLGPSAKPGLKLDVESRPRKSPRALAVAIEVPSDVRLSLEPASGLGAWAQAFHELGHAVGYALNGASRFELALLSGGAAAEVAGVLFEGLLDDPAFCAAQGLPEAKLAAHRKTAALRRLFALRRAAGRALFEVAWRKEPAADPLAKYRSIQQRAFGFPIEPEESERFLWDHEDFFAAADELRARVAAAQLQAALESRAGSPWWQSPKGGAALAEALRDQGRLPLEELVQKWSGSALELSAILTSFQSAMAPGGAKPR